jgi:uncharacterized protein (DUF433 family)
VPFSIPRRRVGNWWLRPGATGYGQRSEWPHDSTCRARGPRLACECYRGTLPGECRRTGRGTAGLKFDDDGCEQNFAHGRGGAPARRARSTGRGAGLGPRLDLSSLVRRTPCRRGCRATRSLRKGNPNANIALPPNIKFFMLKNKPARQPKQPLALLPTYTIPEAATFLAMSSRTLLEWYAGEHPILRPSATLRGIALLSFRDLEEVYKIHLLRFKHAKSLQYLRRAMWDARERTGSQHPLIDNEIDVMDRLALIVPGRGRRKRRAVTLGDRSVPDYFPEVVRTWGVRISATKDEIFPWRYAADDDRSTPVSLNPEVMSGRLVLTGTRIPVNMIWGRARAGEKTEDIARDYRIDAQQVQQALAHIDKALPKVA